MMTGILCRRQNALVAVNYWLPRSGEYSVRNQSEHCAFACPAFWVTLVAMLVYSTSSVALEASPAVDASAPAPDTGLAEILVTAQRRAESLRDVPISVTAVTPQQMVDFNIKDTQELVLITPGLTFDTSYSYAQSYIRGIGSALTNPGLEAAVATYVDGAYLERSLGGVFDLLDTGTVEILKGPQGTLYGRNATGGAILVNTADPTNKEEVHVVGEGGSEGHVMGELVANLPISETLAVRFAARENHDGSYIDNLYDGSKFGQREAGEARVKVRWAPIEDFSAVLGVDHSDISDRVGFSSQRASAPNCITCAIPGSGAAPVTGFYNADNYTNSPFTTRVTSANLQLNYVVRNYAFKSVSAFRNDNTDAQIEADYTSFPFYIYKERQKGKSYSQDVQVLTNGSSWINGLVSASYFHDNVLNYANLSGLAFAPLVEALGSAPATVNDVVTESETVLGEVYLTPIDHLKVTLGARYTHDSRSLNVDANLSGVLAAGGAPTDPTNFNQNADFNSTTPRFVVAYDVGLANLYASYNRGFKAGGFNTPSFGKQAVIQPEKIDSYEIGAKFVSADRKLNANLAAFHYKYSDVQVSVVDFTRGGVIVENAASARGNGAEADITFRATQWLELIGGVSFLADKFDSYPNASIVVPTAAGLVSGTQNLEGYPLTRSPKWSGYIGAKVDHDIGNDWTSHFNIIAHRSAQYDFFAGRGGPLGHDFQPSYTLANLTASIGPVSDKYSVGLYVNNLTNSKYYIQRGTTATFGYFDQAARPITFGLRAQYNF